MLSNLGAGSDSEIYLYRPKHEISVRITSENSRICADTARINEVWCRRKLNPKWGHRALLDISVLTFIRGICLCHIPYIKLVARDKTEENNTWPPLHRLRIFKTEDTEWENAL